jgi:hypothetical protein
MSGVRPVGEGQRDDPKPLPDGFGEDPERERVADTGRPLVDRVECRGSCRDRVWRRQDIGRAWLLVLAPHGMAGQLLNGRHIKEAHGGRRRDHADVPAAIVRRRHKLGHIPRRRRRARDHIKHPAHEFLLPAVHTQDASMSTVPDRPARLKRREICGAMLGKRGRGTMM